MGTDVSEATGRSALGRVGSPGCLLLAILFEAAAKPTLDVGSPDRLDLSQFAGLDHLAGLAHQRVAGVVVGDGEDDLVLFDEGREFLSLGEIEGQRLVADDIEAGLDRRLGDLEVGVVRSGDRNEIDAFGFVEGELAGDHLLVGTVGSLLSDAVIPG